MVYNPNKKILSPPDKFRICNKIFKNDAKCSSLGQNTIKYLTVAFTDLICRMKIKQSLKIISYLIMTMSYYRNLTHKSSRYIKYYKRTFTLIKHIKVIL